MKYWSLFPLGDLSALLANFLRFYIAVDKNFLAFAINVQLTNQLTQKYTFNRPVLPLVSAKTININPIAKDGFVIGTTRQINYSLASKYLKPGQPSFQPKCEGPFCFTATLKNTDTPRVLVKNLTLEPQHVITLPPPGQPQ